MYRVEELHVCRMGSWQRCVRYKFSDLGEVSLSSNSLLQVSRLPATRLGNVDLWLGRGNVDQNGAWSEKNRQFLQQSTSAANSSKVGLAR